MAKNTGPLCAGCDRPVTQGTRLVVGLEAQDSYCGRTDMELGETSAPVHPDPDCIRAACQHLDPERDLARALAAGRASGHDRLSILLEAR